MELADSKLKQVSWENKIPKIRPGQYADGIPFNDINYLGFKMLLKPNHFVSRKSLQDFGKIVKGPSAEFKVPFDMSRFTEAPVKVREVLFLDTHDNRLYNNAFILRRRIEYEDGFPTAVPEIVFKFRHADLQKAAETDVRPVIRGDFEIKFKAQVLPLKNQLGGTRLLYSHNMQCPRDHVGKNEVTDFDTLIEVLPVLKTLRKEPGEKIELVNQVYIEEVLLDIGSFDFGGGMSAKANVGIWRTRGDHHPLIAEFAYQVKIADRKDIKPKLMQKAEDFFVALQHSAKNWISLNATKTAIVYNLMGNATKSAE
jgi:hypothetical protein